MYRNLCIFSWTVLSFKSLQIWSQAASMKLTVLSPVVLKPVLVSTCTCTKGSQNLRDQHLKLYLFLLQVGFVCSFFCWIPMKIYCFRKVYQKSYFNGLKINIGPTICEMNKTFFFLKIYLIEHKLNEWKGGQFRLTCASSFI